MTTTVGALPESLVAHLTSWTGGWPPPSRPPSPGNPRNAAPGWDGQIHPVTGVVDPDGPRPHRGASGRTRLPRRRRPSARAATWTACSAPSRRRSASPGTSCSQARSAGRRRPRRWPTRATGSTPTTPSCPTGCGRSVARCSIARDDDGSYLAGVGIKRHDANGPRAVRRHRTRGAGSWPGATACRTGGSRVCSTTASWRPTSTTRPTWPPRTSPTLPGFPDLGWRVLGMFDPAEFADSAAEPSRMRHGATIGRPRSPARHRVGTHPIGGVGHLALPHRLRDRRGARPGPGDVVGLVERSLDRAGDRSRVRLRLLADDRSRTAVRAVAATSRRASHSRPTPCRS